MPPSSSRGEGASLRRTGLCAENVKVSGRRYLNATGPDTLLQGAVQGFLPVIPDIAAAILFHTIFLWRKNNCGYFSHLPEAEVM